MASIKAVTQVIEKIKNTYEGWNPKVDPKDTISAWAEYLSEIEDEVFIEALDRYMKISVSKFPPALPVLIKISRKIQEVNIAISETDVFVMERGVTQNKKIQLTRMLL